MARSILRQTFKALIGALLCHASLLQAATLKIATLAPEGSSWMKEMRTAASEIKTATVGRIELKFYPGGVMGDEATVLRKMKLGQLQGGAFAANEVAGVNPDVQIYGLPFLFANKKEADEARKQLDPLIREGFKTKGYVVLGITGAGFANLMSTKPINTIDQVQATKVWVPNNDRVSLLSFQEAGISPVVLSIADVYTSLQTGLVETAGNIPTGTIAFQWHTKLKYMFDLPLAYVPGFLMLDQRAFEKLSPEDQAHVLKIGSASFDRMNEANFADEGKAREALLKQGMTFIKPSPKEAQAWRSVAQKAIEKMQAEGMFSKQVLDAAQSAIASSRAANP
jgi:TRAP-type C4-dicarboxylate transport system substrate-binding protein